MDLRWRCRNRRRTLTASATTEDAPAGGSLTAAYRYCLQLARAHYENFPVASLFIPAELRPPLAAVYAYARLADDMADEGALASSERLKQLQAWQERLDRAAEGRPDHPVFLALADTLRRYRIPRQPFDDLLTAFRWDALGRNYENFEDLLGYCRCSANPVGRIVLYLFADASPRNLEHSDAICTALQLTNFWQDLSVDPAKGRFYLPLEDLRQFRYTEADLRGKIADARFRDLLRLQVDRTWKLFRAGYPLVHETVPPLRRELALTWNGGTRILRMIERHGYDVLSRRPRLRLADKLSVMIRSFLPGMR